MSPLLLAALQVVAAMGAEINDVKRLDVSSDVTKVSITWRGNEGMTTYTERFDGSGEEALAWEILEQCLAVASEKGRR